MALTRTYEQRLVDDSSARTTPPTCVAPVRTPSAPTKPLLLTGPPPTTSPKDTAQLCPPCFKHLTLAEMAAKRERKECYNCAEKFSREHLKVCPVKGVFLLQLDNVRFSDEDKTEDPWISLNAITGISPAKTLQLSVRVAGATLGALIDSGSTHSFILASVARRLLLQPTPRPGLNVMVANGDHVPNDGVCYGVHIFLNSEEFVIDLFVIPLDGYDMVLGVHWLRTLGPLLWDFNKARLSCWRDDHQVTLQGISRCQSSAAVQSISAANMMPLLLQVYDEVFAAPTRLPPPRQHNHIILLLPDTAPTVVCPYHYPQLVKDELEQQCHDMLQQGIIRSSSSAFSSLVLLVKKHDGLWRFYVDYRSLNAKTVCDMFPIPVVDELLDELCGACFFTKLDLRSDYHQVRMEEADIEKIAFQTHHHHFKFLVMLFGLTNAPATFQALMNVVLHDFIRHFVLVFFDDILIFNNSWTEHLQHVRAVLQRLRDHKLAVKRSNCTFGTESVAYLGHVITAQGVAMDADKVAAVQAWRSPCSVRAIRIFLGLTSYYRKFIQSYGEIAAPLTNLLKREAFGWTQEAEEAFESLKAALTTTPVLHLPDFTKTFTVDGDASRSGFGAVLHQGGGPIAFFSHAVVPHHVKLAAYERELIGLVKAVRHWRPYLWPC
jgi:hypothetical protein